MQRTEIDLHQHRDDHHPDEQAHRQIDLRDFKAADGLKDARKHLAQPDAGQDAERDPDGQIALEDAQPLPGRRLGGDFTLCGHWLHSAWMRRAAVRRSSGVMDSNGSREQGADAALQFAVGDLKGGAPRLQGLHMGRVVDPPMGGHRVTRPHRAGLARGTAADGEDQIELRRAGRGELVPGLAARLAATARRVPRASPGPPD